MTPRGFASGHAEVVAILESGLAGRYTVLEAIGQGGMALVFRARDLRHDRDVALKVLRPELAVALGAERFEREIKIEARLNHPNVLAVFDSGQCRHLLYYVAPWAEEGSLFDRLRKEAPLGIDEAMRIAREIGGALSHAHANGVIHRDVKPDNVLFRSGHAMLADFGIARAIAERGSLSSTDVGLVVGTPHYMSPEQCTSGAPIDERTDQYALACIVFEMLTGDPPFSGRNAQAIIARHMTERPPSLTVIRPDTPPSVVAAIGRALSKHAGDRFPSVEGFITALVPVGGTPPQGILVTRRSRARWWGVSGVVGAVAAAALFTTTRGPALSSSNVAIFPLATRGLVTGDSGIGIGISYLLEAALERAEPLRLIDVGGELSPETMLNPEAISGAAARRIARRARAAWMLRGVIQGHPDSVTLILRLFSVNGDSLVRQVSATGSTAGTLLHHLGLDALKQLLPFLIDSTRTVDMAPLRERSAAAVALWMQGERRYRQSRFSEAVEFYERALAADSAMALAAVKGALAATWAHDQAKAGALTALALSGRSLLPPRYVAFARALDLRLRGVGDSAAAALEALERAVPDWAEAPAALGETYLHLLPSEGTGEARATAAFGRSFALDSGLTPPLFHLAEIAIRDGRTKEGEGFLARFEEVEPDVGLVTQLTIMRDCVADGGDAAWTRAGMSPASSAMSAARALSAGLRQMPCAESGFRALLRSPITSDGDRWGAFLGLQGVLIARGATKEARTLIDSVVTAGKGVARSLYVLGAAAGADMSVPAAELEAYARTTYGEDYARVRTSEALWILSVWHLSSGDVMRLRTLDALLRSRAATTGDERDRAFSIAAEAHLAIAVRDTSRAITLLQQLVRARNAVDIVWGFGSAFAPDRLLLAELLLATGRPHESAAVAAALDHEAPITFIAYVPMSLSVRYRAARALGNESAAMEARRRLERLGRQDLIR